jgi:predicted RNase H-like nuclease (RuvC/YqgF family)
MNDRIKELEAEVGRLSEENSDLAIVVKVLEGYPAENERLRKEVARLKAASSTGRRAFRGSRSVEEVGWCVYPGDS